jgi:hypothetical protein
VREAYLRSAGYSTRALENMESHVRTWDRWMRAAGEFYDYRDSDGFGRVYQVQRGTIRAFITRCFSRGALLDQLQMHVADDDGIYRIRTVCFDEDGRVMGVPGVAEEVSTGSTRQTFGIVRPAVPNTRVDFSPYGHSVFADAVDAVQSVDLPTTRSSTRWTRARCACSCPT